MNIFDSMMSLGAAAVSGVCGDEFEIRSGGKGIPGTYPAISIDELAFSKALIPGGTLGDNTVNIYINRDTLDRSELEEGAKLLARGKKLRVLSSSDGGDDAILLVCGPAGVTFR